MSRNRRKASAPDYVVGYAKPPAHSRFQPGQSGNPKGRPKKVQTQEDPLERVLSQPIPIVIDGKRKIVPASEAVMQKFMQMALSKDDPRALITLVKLIVAKQTRHEKPPEVEEEILPDDEAVIARYLGRQGESPGSASSSHAGGGDE